MTSTLPILQKVPDKQVIFQQLRIETAHNRAQTQRQLQIARTMKAMGHDFVTIFEVTGLQPEIIQSI